LAKCYVEADAEDVLSEAGALVSELNGVSARSPVSRGVLAPVRTAATTQSRQGRPDSLFVDFFTNTYCHQSRFFHPKNGPRIAAIREEIARRGLSCELEAVALVSLMEAADRVDSTTGVQMA